MKYTIEKKSPICKIIFELTVAEWETALEGAYQKTKMQYVVNGFRPGCAPRKTIEAKFGASTFVEDAFDVAFPIHYAKALSENKDIEPVETPRLEVTDISAQGVKFAAEFYVKPSVTLGQYKGLKIESAKTEVTDQDIENELKTAQERASRKVVVQTPIKKGDFVNLDYKGLLVGVAFAGGTAQNQELEIGSNTFIPGFEEQLIGLMAGEEKPINVTFPTDYHSEHLAGKAVVFECKINAVMEKKTPKLDDELAKDVSSFDTLAAYKKDIKEKLEKANQANMENANVNKLLETITGSTVVDIPQCMIEEQVDQYIHEFEHRVAQSGLKLADYLKYTGTDMKGLREMRTEDANKTVKLRLALEKIVDNEKLEPQKEEVDEKLKKRAEMRKVSFEEYKKGVQQQEVAFVVNELIMDKLIAWLKANNQFVGGGKPTSKASDKANASKETAPKAQQTTATKEAVPKAAKTATAKEPKPAAKKPATTKK
ncbi:MAG: trigger factor [Firmicutes bacterium]|nr:trigger factor [Bacillota bacterium]